MAHTLPENVADTPDVMFEVREPGEQAEAYFFRHPIIKIGSDRRSNLCLANERSASRMHAVIEVPNEPDADLTFIDLGNEPGSYINGKRVNKCKIKRHDVIMMSGFKLPSMRCAKLPAAVKRKPERYWAN